MPARGFRQVDVFTEVPTRGNPVAVVHDAEGLEDDQLQAFAAWTNLSETTFLLPPIDPSADYRVRILTPGGELPFAGHPTLGTAHAWLEAGGVPASADEVVQECGLGLVRIRWGERLAFAAPPSEQGELPADVVDELAAALGIGAGQVLDARLLTNGPVWATLLLDRADTVLGLQPNRDELRDLPMVGVVGAHGPGAECAIEIRAFADPLGIPEDPVTGSLNASVAQWLTGTGRLPSRYVAAQGTCLGRRGRVHVDVEGDDVWIGGGTHTLIAGEVMGFDARSPAASSVELAPPASGTRQR
jgi:PhzF family phenazine biosynthesis protein